MVEQEIFDRRFFIVLAVATFSVMAIWEYLSQRKRVGSDVRFRSYRTNLINLAVNNLILLIVSIEFFYTLSSYKSSNLLPRLFTSIEEITSYAPHPLLELAIQFIILDFLFYILHLINHKFDFLWNFHKVHHSDIDLNASTGFRFHIGELLLSLLYKGCIVLTLGISPRMMIVFEFITVYTAMFHHSNVRIPGEPFLRYLLVMPSHHATHHSVPRKHHDSNYGVVFSIWDYLLRTYDSHQPQRFGIPQTQEMGFFKLFRFPLSRLYLIIIIGLTGGFLLTRYFFEAFNL